MNKINWEYLKNGDEMYLATVPEEGYLVVVSDGNGRYNAAYFMDYEWYEHYSEDEDVKKIKLNYRLICFHNI